MTDAISTIENIKNGKKSAVDAVSKTITDIKEKNKDLNAFLEVFENSALKQAEKIDRKISTKEKIGRLAGIAIAIKDNILYKDHISSCGSKILRNYKAVYNSTAVEKLLAEDAVIIGRTNMDEFAMGSSCENSAFGPVKNPFDLTRVSGGSSGGSAAAVGSDMVIAALGSDTSGSVRQPAAFCNAVGLRPTYGRVSRYGLVAFASSLDQIGPITKTVSDSALLLSVLAGTDKKDSTCADMEPMDYLEKTKKVDTKKLKIGIPKEYFTENLDKEIATAIKETISKLSARGFEFVDISLPHTKYSIPAYYIIAPSEASSNLARFDGIRYGYSDNSENNSLQDVYKKSRQTGFGAEVKRRIMLGAYSLSSGYYDAYYLKAQKVRTLIRQDFESVFKEVDIILSPTTPAPAFKLGEKTKDPVSMYLADAYVGASSLAGVPAISIPCGKTKDNLPIGLQLIGNYFKEENLFAFGMEIEKLYAGK